MPVVEFAISRINKFFPNKKLNEILEILPFIGVDIEGINSEIIRIEYNPNRPDFSSDYGIARSLRGLLGIELGIPEYKLLRKEEYVVMVDPIVKQVRPYIVALVAKKGRLDDMAIKQLINMQEDLHNGIGRRRKKASIGIHNLDVITFPLYYKGVENDSFSFIPLEKTSPNTIREILNGSESGRKHGHILKHATKYPIIIDTKGKVISFPPIINADISRVDAKTSNLFVEVTANSQRTADDILAILAITLNDIGFEIQTVLINDSVDRTENRYTPILDPLYIDVEIDYINKMLGLDLNAIDISRCLKKSRLEAYVKKQNGNIICCIIPRYRTDIIHPIDIVEEVLIGYGVYNLKPDSVASTLTGQRNQLSIYTDAIRESLIGMGLLEVTNFSLIGRKLQYKTTDLNNKNNNNGKKNTNDDSLTVEETKSREHEMLRGSLIPSLLSTLSHNVHEEYPQKLFEIGKIFERQDNNSINEYWCAGVVIAHTATDFTEIKSIIQTLLKLTFGKDILTKPTTNAVFIKGRCAEIIMNDTTVGILGEVSPAVIENFKIRMPVTSFELNLSSMLNI